MLSHTELAALGANTAAQKGQQALRTTARIFQCLAHGGGQPPAAAQYASTRGNWVDRDQIHRVLMAAVTGATQASDSSLVGVRSNDLLSFIRPATIIGRLQGIRRTSFDAAVTTMTGCASAGWIGGGKAIPFSKPVFSRLASPLGRLKIAAMCAEDDELVKYADPDAELTIGADFAAACVAAADVSFIDAASAAIADARPSAVTNGSPAFASGGSTALLIDADLGRLIESLLARGSTLQFAHWIIHPITAAFLARLRNANGDYAYPDVTVLGGMLMGLPVVVSASVPHVGSPSVTAIYLLDAARVWLAEDSSMELFIAKSATVQFLDNPTNDITTPTATTLVSAFQTNTVILRGVRTMNWRISDTGFAAVLNGFVD